MQNDNTTMVPRHLPFKWGDLKAISEQTGIPYTVVSAWRKTLVHEPTETNNLILEAAVALFEKRKKAFDKAKAIAEHYSSVNYMCIYLCLVFG